MTLQEVLKRVDVLPVNSTFGQQHHIDAVNFFASGNEHAVQEVQIQTFRGRELEETERLVGRPFNRTLERAEIGCSHPHWPRQQQYPRELGANICAAVPGRHFMPSSRNPRILHAGIA